MSYEYEYEDGKDAWKRYRRTIESIDPEVQTMLHEFGAAQFGYGYIAGIQAAREAVAEWIDKRRSHDFRTCDDRDHDCYLFRDALAAIDALRFSSGTLTATEGIGKS